jgi:hypothetical protein
MTMSPPPPIPPDGDDPTPPANPADRARLEDEEERRAAEHAAAVAARRAATGEDAHDQYVARRVAAENQLRAALDREAIETEEREAVTPATTSWWIILAVGLLLSLLLLGLISFMERGAARNQSAPTSTRYGFALPDGQASGFVRTASAP